MVTPNHPAHSIRWAYREDVGVAAEWAPHVGGYWAAEWGDLRARVWRDGEFDTVLFDVRLQGRNHPHDTPESCGTDESIDAAKRCCERSLVALDAGTIADARRRFRG